ncbi:hypothetical protein E2C01_071918 [Portunus trituberculatus]|uniref:Uncharacterized protein n=1 Tax=Portunus trituberculatus TaxID=210409 RepID=A0A5B7I9Q1_PORTR|nr:hypothetical protein [Portunus trituberculatus]
MGVEEDHKISSSSTVLGKKKK